MVFGTVKVTSVSCLCLLCKDIHPLLCFVISVMLLILLMAYEPAHWVNELLIYGM